MADEEKRVQLATETAWTTLFPPGGDDSHEAGWHKGRGEFHEEEKRRARGLVDAMSAASYGDVDLAAEGFKREVPTPEGLGQAGPARQASTFRWMDRSRYGKRVGFGSHRKNPRAWRRNRNSAY